MTLMLLDNTITGGQAQACSLAYLFSGEKRLKDVGLHLLGHSYAGVSHG
jgi:hypothetical protein